MKVEFLNEPGLQPVGAGDEWMLLEDFWVRIDSESGDAPATFRIPKGFSTDLASVPRLPGAYLFFGGTARRAAILHDWLYDGRYPRRMADDIFYAAMEGEVTGWRRWVMWAAVRVGGGAYYP